MVAVSLDLLGLLETIGSSIVKQFEESEFPNRKFSIYIFVSYFLSPYAISCILVGIALNRIRFIILQQFNVNNNFPRENNDPQVQQQQQQQFRPRARFIFDRNSDLVFEADSSNGRNISYFTYVKWKYRWLITSIIQKWQPFIKFMFRLMMVVILLLQLHRVLVALNCYLPFFNKYFGSSDSIIDTKDWLKFTISTTNFTFANGTSIVRPDLLLLAPMSKNLTSFLEKNYKNISVGSATSILNYTTTSEKNFLSNFPLESGSTLAPPSSFEFGNIGPSTSFLATLFTTLCLSQIVESFCTCISGQSRLISMSAMSIFEISVNFHEFHQENIFTISSMVSDANGTLELFETTIAPTKEFLVLCIVLILENIAVHLSRMFNRPQWKLALSCTIHIPFCAYWLNSFYIGRQAAYPTVFTIVCASQIINMFIISMSSFIYVISWICSWSTNLDNGSRNSSSSVTLNMNNLNLMGDSDDFLSLTLKLSMATLVSSVNRSYVRNVSYVCLRKDTWLIHELLRIQNESKKQSGNTNDNKNVRKEDNLDKQPYLTEYATAPDLQDDKEGSSEGNTDKDKPKLRIIRTLNESGELLKIFTSFLYYIIFRNEEFEDKYQKEEERSKELSHTGDEESGNPGEKSKLNEKEDKCDGVLFYEKTNNGIDYKSLLEGKLAPDDDDDDEYYIEEDDYVEDEDDYDEVEDQDEPTDESEEKTVKKGNILLELFNVEDFYRLLGLSTEQRKDSSMPQVGSIYEKEEEEITENMMQFDESVKDIMKNHLLLDRDVPITRQQYRTIFDTCNTDELPKTDVEKLARLLLEKEEEKKEKVGQEDDEQEKISKQYTCAICQMNPRQIILWPCKCLAICEECRVSLMVREFDRCVCCRRLIEGYSKIYIP